MIIAQLQFCCGGETRSNSSTKLGLGTEFGLPPSNRKGAFGNEGALRFSIRTYRLGVGDAPLIIFMRAFLSSIKAV